MLGRDPQPRGRDANRSWLQPSCVNARYWGASCQPAFGTRFYAGKCPRSGGQLPDLCCVIDDYSCRSSARPGRRRIAGLTESIAPLPALLQQRLVQSAQLGPGLPCTTGAALLPQWMRRH
jgi:hypothetical protein